MGRKSAIWKRKGRGYHTTINGCVYFLGHDKAEAHTRFRDLMMQQMPTRPGKHSIADLVVLYLKAVHGRIAPKTYKHYKSSLEAWVEHTTHLRPAELRAYHLYEWLEQQSTWGQSMRATVASHVRIWSSWAEQRDYIDADRLRKVRVDPILVRKPAKPEDLLKLEAAITSDDFRDAYVFLYDTGCRPGELYTLTAERVDLAESTALVCGKTGDRTVGLTPRLVAILRRRALRWPEGAVFRREDGEPWTASALRNRFERFQKLAKCSSHIVPYHPRHDLYRRWTAAGVEELVVAKQLGHFKAGLPHLQMLAKTYAHVGGHPLAQAARLVEPGEAKKRKRG